MAAVTLLDVQDLCPDVARVPEVWLRWVNKNISGGSFDGEDGETTQIIRCYLAAHFAIIGDTLGGSAGGAIASETEGGISRSYAVGDISANALNRTGYGASALQLMRTYVAGAWIADPCA